MIGMRISQAKGLFFDRQRVKNAVDRTTRRVLSRFGAFVRTRAKSSIRKRKKSAPPGKPPSSHTGLLKKFIFFGYDQYQQSVVIGPVKLNAQGQEVPHTLEQGGVTAISYGKNRGKRIRVEARPFMGPAFDKELQENMPDMWRDSVRR